MSTSSARSMRLGDLTREEVLALLAQHHRGERGRNSPPEALETVWDADARPALARECPPRTGPCFSVHPRPRPPAHSHGGRRRGRAGAADRLSRDPTSISWPTSSRKDRVRRVVGPLLSGGDEREFTARDIEYARAISDSSRRNRRCASPIQSTPKSSPRELTWAAQEGFVEDSAWYVDDAGGLDLVKLLTAFQAFFREHSEHWVERFDYREAGPQLLLQAFLQRNRQWRWPPSSVSHGLGARSHRSPSSYGRTAIGPAGSSSSARCSTRAWNGQLRKGSGRPPGTWTGARRKPAIWSSLTGMKRGRWDEKVFCRKESAEGVDVVVWGM